MTPGHLRKFDEYRCVDRMYKFCPIFCFTSAHICNSQCVSSLQKHIIQLQGSWSKLSRFLISWVYWDLFLRLHSFSAILWRGNFERFTVMKSKAWMPKCQNSQNVIFGDDMIAVLYQKYVLEIILYRKQYVTSCGRVQCRFLRKWLWTGFECGKPCRATGGTPQAMFCLERSDNRVVEGVCVTYRRYFYLISDSQKRGVYLIFVWWWIYLRPCEKVCV